MNPSQESLETLKDIRQMMDRSTRFISLSGWSGVAAGATAILSACYAKKLIGEYYQSNTSEPGAATSLYPDLPPTLSPQLVNQLFCLALMTLLTALVLAFLLTWLRTRKTGSRLWTPGTRKLVSAFLTPMVTGGIFLLALMKAGAFSFLAPGCLLFYGLALVAASRYTLSDIKWLGFAELILAMISLWYAGKGLWFWTLGFGVLHIIYGLLMWWKYERN